MHQSFVSRHAKISLPHPSYGLGERFGGFADKKRGYSSFQFIMVILLGMYIRSPIVFADFCVVDDQMIALTS